MNIQPVDINRLPVMTHQGMPVATTDMLATLYGTENENLRQNFRRNKDRFIEGKHFISLEGEALRDFRSCVTNGHSPFCPSAQARVVNLWTERGAARHAKMLDTDAAWDVFEALEDAYFRSREQDLRAENFVAQPVAPRGVISPAELDELMVAIPVREYLTLKTPAASAIQPVERTFLGHYSDDVRAAVFDLANKGWQPADIADKLGIQRDTVKTMLYRARKAGEIPNGPKQGEAGRKH